MKKIQVILLSILCLFMVTFMTDEAAFAENAQDPAPILIPEQSNEKSVLFDNSHGQTSGQSDWVIDGAFSDFADALVEEGYTVKEFRSDDPLTIQDIKDYDVFVIPEANIPFTVSEQEAIATYAEQGGAVFFIADHYNADRNLNRWDSNEIMNGWRRGAFEDPTKGMSADEAKALQGVENSTWLSDEFGVEFRYNAIDRTVANQVVSPDESFGITEGVNEVSIHAGSTLAITDPEIAKGIVYLPDGLTESANKWAHAVDQGVYAGGGVEEGPFVAIGKKGLGKSAFIGDSSPVEDATPKYLNEETGRPKTTYDGFIAHDNARLLVNIVHWLAEDENYDSFDETSITLDDPTPRLEMEDPLQSTEPQEEPWREPREGYVWYDTSTFADGAYGSDVDPPAPLIHSIITPDVLPNNGEPFEVTVRVEGLAPNSTVDGYRIQVYVEGGRSISQVQNSDGSWPNHYGYFDIGSFTANSEGIAEKTVTMRLNRSTTATEGFIRVKNSSGDNVITESVVIGEGSETEDPPSEEEPPGDGETQVFEKGNYKLILPKTLPENGEAFPVQVEITGLEPGTMINNAQIQVYLDGGKSISQIQNADGTWPSRYGYGHVGTLTANNDGIATGEVMMRMDPSTTAKEANIRLRLGSGNNVLTSKIQLP